MGKIYSASEAELEVLEKLWDLEDGIKQSRLLALFEADGKEWKRQTLNTFLSRLEEKGLVKRENRIVRPTGSREEYHYQQIQHAIDTMYDGQLSKLVAAFIKMNNVNESETKEMLRLLNNYKNTIMTKE